MQTIKNNEIAWKKQQKKKLGYEYRGKQSKNFELEIDGETYFEPRKVATHLTTSLQRSHQIWLRYYLLDFICSILKLKFFNNIILGKCSGWWVYFDSSNWSLY